MQKLLTRRRHLLGRPDAPARRPRIRSSPFREKGSENVQNQQILNFRLAFVDFEILLTCFLNVLG